MLQELAAPPKRGRRTRGPFSRSVRSVCNKGISTGAPGLATSLKNATGLEAIATSNKKLPDGRFVGVSFDRKKLLFAI